MSSDPAPPPAQVRVAVAPAHVELVSDLLWSAGARGIEERPAGPSVLLLAGFDDLAAAERGAASLRPGAAVDTTPPVASLEVVPLPADDEWLDAWRAHARAQRAGPFVVVPAWLDPPTAAAGTVTLVIDPGRAFGSGSHPTTRLVLGEVARLVAPGDRVLDVGCGSGVLAVAAARVGAGRVVAVDINPAAVVATEANAAANGVDGVVTASATPLADVSGAFAVVLANLLAPDIVRLAADLAARVAPDGFLVLSGLLADRWPATTAHLPGWTVEHEAVDEGWAAITLRRDAPRP
ncbi:MAG: ribosomal protein methyltransferase [Acidimicrobiales bacterium]|nr:ribosomal protein methyltransferase [Acidimicrobiales bacterium]